MLCAADHRHPPGHHGQARHLPCPRNQNSASQSKGELYLVDSSADVLSQLPKNEMCENIRARSIKFNASHSLKIASFYFVCIFDHEIF